MRRSIAVARFGCFALAAAAFLWLGAVKAADVDPKVATITPADQIKWSKTASVDTAVLAGDPTKPGIYVILVKWHPHKMSRPHFHPNDRYITVLSGTWWVGTGSTYDPDHTVPVHAGSYVRHFAKQIHYDGAKDEEVVLEIVGDGPETMTPAEKK
ncbi:MAG: cupin domain-containing protein [Acidobacteriia bacterium]|nr:cupin domain-containing protein [Terriglobia bacterium]